MTQYFVAKPNDPTIYMATYITGEVSPGELRFLARLRRSAVPNGWHGDVGNLDGCTAFEGKDTFKCPNGQTRCKMYTADRFIEDVVHGVTGNVSLTPSPPLQPIEKRSKRKLDKIPQLPAHNETKRC